MIQSPTLKGDFKLEMIKCSIPFSWLTYSYCVHCSMAVAIKMVKIWKSIIQAPCVASNRQPGMLPEATFRHDFYPKKFFGFGIWKALLFATRGSLRRKYGTRKWTVSDSSFILLLLFLLHHIKVLNCMFCVYYTVYVCIIFNVT